MIHYPSICSAGVVSVYPLMGGEVTNSDIPVTISQVPFQEHGPFTYMIIHVLEIPGK